MMKVGDLIFCRGQFWGIILDMSSDARWTKAIPEWIQVFWNTGLTTWEEVEPSFDDPEVMRVIK